MLLKWSPKSKPLRPEITPIKGVSRKKRVLRKKVILQVITVILNNKGRNPAKLTALLE